MIYYFREKNECDFVVKDRSGRKQAIQVCYKLEEDTLRREMKGLKEAMEVTGLKKGTIITLDQEDKFDDIDVIPAWKWLSKMTTHV